MGTPGRPLWDLWVVVVAFIVLTVSAGCRGDLATTAPAPTPVRSDAALTPSPTAAETTGPASTTSPLSSRPLVWFAPLGPRADHMGFGGSVDYYDLFKPGAAWPIAASRVDVFMVYATWVDYYSTDAELRQVVEGVAARGLVLGLEIGGLTPSDACGSNVEGFDASLDPIRRIQAAGGSVGVVQFDEVYAGGHVYDGPNACRWPVERVASGVADFVRTLRTVTPDVMVGDVEPMWANVSASDLGAWMDAYREAAGEPFEFFHLDADWGLADWPERALAATKEAQARGIPVGLIYNGGDAGSDKAWNDAAFERIETYEGRLGGRPDQIVFQSWTDHPDHVLPESDPTTFTGLLSAYFGDRSALSVGTVRAPGAGRLEVDGSLLDTDGAPVPNATVTLTATPLDGSYQELRLDGRVPAEATSAVVALRVNEEGAGPGPADLTLYEVRYSEGGAKTNRVPNPRFGHGLDLWGAGGSGVVRTRPSDRGSGWMLRVEATPSQSVGINSGEFGVTAGAEYRFSVAARIPVDSIGSAYLAVVFLHGTEVARYRIHLAPLAVSLGHAATDPSGGFRIAAADLEPGGYRLRLEYAGDASHWPAHAEQEITVK